MKESLSRTASMTKRRCMDNPMAGCSKEVGAGESGQDGGQGLLCRLRKILDELTNDGTRK